MSELNPYQPPSAHVSDIAEDSDAGVFLPEGRKVGAGRGLAWITDSLRMVFARPGVWLLIGLSLIALTFLMLFIPMVNAAMGVLYPVFAGGIIIAARKQRDGQLVEVGDIFAGFREKATPLILIGVLYLALTFGLGMLVLGVSLVTGIGAAVLSGDAAVAAGIGITMVLVMVMLFVLITVALYSCIWLAPALVVFHDVAPFEAMKSSLLVSLRNWSALLIYSLVGAVLGVLAFVPLLGFGLVPLVPAMMASAYFAYRDLYIED